MYNSCKSNEKWLTDICLLFLPHNRYPHICIRRASWQFFQVVEIFCTWHPFLWLQHGPWKCSQQILLVFHWPKKSQGHAYIGGWECFCSAFVFLFVCFLWVGIIPQDSTREKERMEVEGEVINFCHTINSLFMLTIFFPSRNPIWLCFNISLLCFLSFFFIFKLND